MINQHQKAFKEEVEKTRVPLGKRPDWLKVKLPTGDNFSDVRNLMREKKLNTVCEEAKCPNIAECWNHRTATFMILGDTCTRSCGFCNVKLGMPTELHLDEPRRVVDAIKQLNLRHAVITSVNRDELEDGGSSIFKECVRLVREEKPDCTVEILIPDFKGDEKAFEIIMQSPPDILNHNLETVARLYHAVRPQAKYERSLNLIKWFKSKGLRRRRRVNKVSVYRILEDFSRLGLVRQVPVTGGSAHYELACEHHPPHPHFQCRECGDLECLEPVSLEQVRREIEGVLGRRAEGLEVRVAGVCRRCDEAG